MVAGKHRSNTFRKVFRKTPGGRTVTHYKKREDKKALCAGCAKVLPGTINSSKAVMKNMAKSKKRPERPYGGVLCTECTRRVMIDKARSE